MTLNVAKEYGKLRARGWHAREALRYAKVLKRWDDVDGYVAWEGDNYPRLDSEPYEYGSGYGPVRIVVRSELEPYDDSYIDTWDDSPIVVDGTRMTREEFREWLWARIERDGVHGIESQFWNGVEWEHADSVWGFVGDDWRDSGYDADLMSAALDELDAHLADAARAIESERPDLYGSN